MGHHDNGRRHHSGSYQELCALMLERLGGLPEDPEPTASAPAADEWVSGDEWARQHAGKAGAR